MGWGFTKNQKLRDAAEAGDNAKVSELLAAGAEVNSKNLVHGWTALHVAARFGHPDIVDILLKAPFINVNVPDNSGQTVVHKLAKRGYVELLRRVKEKGANMDASSKKGTPLTYAVKNCDDLPTVQDTATCLIELGCDAQSSDEDGATALYLCAERDYHSIACMLLEHGSPPDANGGKKSRHMSPLCVAASKGFDETVKLLLARGAQADYVDEDGNTPLLHSINAASVEAVQYLLAAGAKPTLTNNTGLAPLHSAAQSGLAPVLYMLLGVGVSVESTQTRAGKAPVTPLHVTCADADLLEATRVLIGAGADVNNVSSDRVTPLLLAVQGGLVDTVQLLLAAGATNDVEQALEPAIVVAARLGDSAIVRTIIAAEPGCINCPNTDGNTALVVAVLHKRRDVVETLLACGADANATNHRGHNALYYACGMHKKLKMDLSLVRLLLAKQAESNFVVEQCSPLLHAAKKGRLELMRVLVAGGADVNSTETSSRSETLLHVAVAQGAQDVATVLIGMGANLEAKDASGLTPRELAKQKYTTPRSLDVWMRIFDNVASLNGEERTNGDAETKLLSEAISMLGTRTSEEDSRRGTINTALESLREQVKSLRESEVPDLVAAAKENVDNTKLEYTSELPAAPHKSGGAGKEDAGASSAEADASKSEAPAAAAAAAVAAGPVATNDGNDSDSSEEAAFVPFGN